MDPVSRANFTLRNDCHLSAAPLPRGRQRRRLTIWDVATALCSWSYCADSPLAKLSLDVNISAKRTSLSSVTCWGYREGDRIKTPPGTLPGTRLAPADCSH